jgi:hypothetical protein
MDVRGAVADWLVLQQQKLDAQEQKLYQQEQKLCEQEELIGSLTQLVETHRRRSPLSPSKLAHAAPLLSAAPSGLSKLAASFSNSFR